MTLNMKNYKGYEKKPYCNAHYPKQSFTMVADTPENLRLKQQSELQSQIKYHEEFERSRMGPSPSEGSEPERRNSQESSGYRRPAEQQHQPSHHVQPTNPEPNVAPFPAKPRSRRKTETFGKGLSGRRKRLFSDLKETAPSETAPGQ
ncbi:LIM and SH3 domain protein 1 [Manacus vitellinus]|uniref:LIM and SH3 domain protein 1 n=1 Tax=Manacus vitellinus TaxID=328815 RepID=UPI00115E9C76|nr:LIM and SH3 domain protein 1 [Manacus vitellinus]